MGWPRYFSCSCKSLTAHKVSLSEMHEIQRAVGYAFMMVRSVFSVIPKLVRSVEQPAQTEAVVLSITCEEHISEEQVDLR